MKLNLKAYAIAQALTAATLFVVCSFFVGFLPEPTSNFTRYAFQTDLSEIMRPLNIGGFIVGLLVTSLGWGLLSLIMASFYNGGIKTKNLPA